jgi:hypothetical protein
MGWRAEREAGHDGGRCGREASASCFWRSETTGGVRNLFQWDEPVTKMKRLTRVGDAGGMVDAL